MENEFVAKFFQDIDDDVLLQLFLVTFMAMKGELVYPAVYLMFHGTD